MKNVTFALELHIETKKFTRFSKSFVTAKYLDVLQWEIITRMIEKIGKNHVKINNINDEGEFCTDEVNISWKIVPKDESYIRFEKLRFTYVLDWIMQLKITRILPFSDRPITPDVIDIVPTMRSDVVEYEPNNINDQVVHLKSRYKPSNIETSSDKKPTEYSPRAVAVTEFATSKYTPSKIEVDNNIVPSSVSSSNGRIGKVAKRSKMLELFGSLSEDENKGSVGVVLVSSDERLKEEKKTIKKRHLFSGEPKPESLPQKRQKKTKTEQNQSNLDSWMEKSNTPNKIAKRKPSKNKSMTKQSNGLNLLDCEIDAAQLEKMKNFVEQSKQNEMKKAQRRVELEDLELLDCNDISNDDLKR